MTHYCYLLGCLTINSCSARVFFIMASFVLHSPNAVLLNKSDLKARTTADHRFTFCVILTFIRAASPGKVNGKTERKDALNDKLQSFP